MMIRNHPAICKPQKRWRTNKNRANECSRREKEEKNTRVFWYHSQFHGMDFIYFVKNIWWMKELNPSRGIYRIQNHRCENGIWFSLNILHDCCSPLWLKSIILLICLFFFFCIHVADKHEWFQCSTGFDFIKLKYNLFELYCEWELLKLDQCFQSQAMIKPLVCLIAPEFLSIKIFTMQISC